MEVSEGEAQGADPPKVGCEKFEMCRGGVARGEIDRRGGVWQGRGG